MPQLDQLTDAPAVSRSTIFNSEVLDNPIWNALNTEHSALALGGGLARRYPAEIGPLSGLVGQTDAAYEELREQAGPEGVVAQFLESPWEPRPGWELVRDGLMSQMIWSGGARPNSFLPANATLRLLAAADAPAMLELAKLTEPGPFGRRTHELGTFFGIFEADRLVAMAGQRIHLPGFTEVSAVCTHPDARGRGYARAVMLEVIAEIARRGETAFLHVFAANEAAIRVYEGLGFERRRGLYLAVLKAV
ncbi:MAG TPA: GNAT family N-acetyltransferase [Acidobacteriaceae bacterium]